MKQRGSKTTTMHWLNSNFGFRSMLTMHLMWYNCTMKHFNGLVRAPVARGPPRAKKTMRMIEGKAAQAKVSVTASQAARCIGSINAPKGNQLGAVCFLVVLGEATLL
mmetsp:Transcript_6113/g.6739  ORF Transcript_6113/g.6739 Transcript_6113/m.6739 type:complete len:107 (-) Transcript_6113:381-701(-)